MSHEAAAFAAKEAIEAGDWDRFLPALRVTVEARIKATHPERTEEMARQGQVWVWTNNNGWEIRGTGLRLPQGEAHWDPKTSGVYLLDGGDKP